MPTAAATSRYPASTEARLAAAAQASRSTSRDHHSDSAHTIAREAGEKGRWESTRGMGERPALYANLEAGAAQIREYQQTFLPGLLQIRSSSGPGSPPTPRWNRGQTPSMAC